MQINLILIPFVIILGLLFALKDNRKTRGQYILFCSAVLLFIAAMRSPEWFTLTYHIDTLNYKYAFERVHDMGWDELWMSVYQRYFMNTEETDIGFRILNKIIASVTEEFHIYSLIADLLFFVPFGIILYRYCMSMRQIIFAFVFYIALVQVFLLSGGRQIFALGFDMIALLLMIDGKKIFSLITFIFGISLHFSSILFLIPLLLIWFDLKPLTLKTVHLLCFILFPIVLSFPNEVIDYMGNVIGMEKYANYGHGTIQGGAATFLILIEVLSLFCFIAVRKRNLFSNEALRFFYVMAPLFTLFAPLIRSNGTMIRISLYFHLYLAILVPFSIDCMFKKKEQSFAYFFAIGILAFLSMLNGGMVYYFYWQF